MHGINSGLQLQAGGRSTDANSPVDSGDHPRHQVVVAEFKGDYARWEAHNSAQRWTARAKNRNVPAPDKQSLISHAIFAINIVKRLNMFWRKVRAQ